MDIYQVNIILIGRPNVGKSSFINAIMREIFSTTKTIVPQYYEESSLIKSDIKKIKEINNKVNLDQKINSYKSSIHHTIHYDFCDLFKNHNKNIKFTICDTPGYNEICLNWLNEYLHTFDMVFFMTDIMENTMMEDDIKILNFLFSMMQKNDINLFCIMNKCDNMHWDSDKHDLFIDDKTQEKIFISSNEILASIAKKYNINNNKYTAFTPFSSKKYLEDANTVPDTGYMLLKDVFNEYLKNNYVKFITNHLNRYIINYFANNNYLEKPYFIVSVISKHIQIFKEKIGCFDYCIFWNLLTNKINYYVSYVISLSVNIIKNKKYIDEKKFNEIHGEIYNYCTNLCDTIDLLLTMSDVDINFMKNKKKEIVNKLLLIYDQLLIYPNDQRNKNASNLLSFLQNINLYASDQFSMYAKLFLENCFTYEANKFKNEPREIVNLMNYLYYNIDDRKILISYIFNILIHNQADILSSFPKDESLEYLLRVKILIDKYKIKYSKNNIIKLYTYEAFTNKNISHLTDHYDHMRSICFEIRNSTVYKVLFSSDKPRIKLYLENKLIKLLAKS